jgi:riboflavin kinase / FMN adenylyltransferase
MEIVRLESLEPRGWVAPAVTVGNFDGVHRGHQALIRTTVRAARDAGGRAVVLTFDPHPAQVLTPERAPSALMTLAQKAEVMQGMDVDALAVLPFTPALSRESPESFAHLVLRQAVGARTVVVGEDFRFGRRRSGNAATLVALGERMGFRVEAVPAVLDGGEPVSSSRVRDALARGDVNSARSLLGRRFYIDGEVVRGAGRGRTLGIPTANLAPLNETLPATGVYACLGRFGDATEATLRAVANLGRRPTFGGGEVVVEVHLLDWTGDAYGRSFRLEFAGRLREERRFPGIDALLEQVRRDIDDARRVLEKA